MKEVVLNCIGEDCRVSMEKVEEALSQLEVGDALAVQINQICAGTKVPVWARKNGHHVEIIEVEDGEWEIIIEKAN